MPPSSIPFLDHPGPLAFAHRGGAGDWPENTMPAFEGAVALGYRYVETDVHATADGVLVAFHDESLDRVTDRAGLIRELPWSEVSAARVDGREPIPLFEDLLGTFGDLRVNVDPKHELAVAPLVAAIRRTGAAARICVGSFSDARIAAVKAGVGPELCTSLGPKGTARVKAAGYRAPVGRLEGQCLQVPVSAKGITVTDERFVTTAHRLGLQVHVWTIDDPAEMERLLDMGVDGIMTDRPALLRDVLERRGEWHGA
ncbi:MAG TPA: glycerophosphodiester phosphodiesterase [Acidimicrobiales bacterium]|nr:glycerophosphodiester phosphodiesterase [Acidimicrobiales bacterium]